jgi:hypothetical protein
MSLLKVKVEVYRSSSPYDCLSRQISLLSGRSPRSSRYLSVFSLTSMAKWIFAKISFSRLSMFIVATFLCALILLPLNKFDKRSIRVFQESYQRTFITELKGFIGYRDFCVPHRLDCLIHVFDFKS